MSSDIATEIMATYSNVEHSYVLDLFSREVGYATPKVDVRAAIFRDDTILLVKERADGCWTVPGGWADVGESPNFFQYFSVKAKNGVKSQLL